MPTTSLLHVQYHSRHLRKAMGMNIILPALPPPSADGRYPVLYLLHGLSDDYSAWTRYTSIERYAANLPLLLVLPDSGRGFYTDGKNAPRYESHIVDDVIGFIDKWFPTIPTREGRVVAGLSMGGYGSLKLALKFPHLFSAAASHSGCLRIGEVLLRYPDEPEITAERVAIFGTTPADGSEDIFANATDLVTGGQPRPALRIDCGVDDFLIEENRDFHRHLLDLQYNHEYQEHPGNHSWEYWDRHIPDSLAFLARCLGISESGKKTS